MNRSDHHIVLKSRLNNACKSRLLVGCHSVYSPSRDMTHEMIGETHSCSWTIPAFRDPGGVDRASRTGAPRDLGRTDFRIQICWKSANGSAVEFTPGFDDKAWWLDRHLRPPYITAGSDAENVKLRRKRDANGSGGGVSQ